MPTIISGYSGDETGGHPEVITMKATFDIIEKEELEEIASHASSADLDSARVAMLVIKDLSYGVSRMYEAYRKSPLTDVKVFRDEAEAIEWLRE